MVAGRRNNGFTLIELLVVVVLIGIIGSYVVVSTGITGSFSTVQPIVEKIRESFVSASRMAILDGLPVGVSMDDSRITFLGYSRDGWFQLGDEELTPVDLPEQWQYSLTAESSVPELPVKVVKDDTRQKVQPRLLFYPDGSTSGALFEVFTETSEQLAGIRVSVNGRVQLINDSAQDNEL
jgi:type II secretion system protein H